MSPCASDAGLAEAGTRAQAAAMLDATCGRGRCGASRPLLREVLHGGTPSNTEDRRGERGPASVAPRGGPPSGSVRREAVPARPGSGGLSAAKGSQGRSPRRPLPARRKAEAAVAPRAGAEPAGGRDGPGLRAARGERSRLSPRTRRLPAAAARTSEGRRPGRRDCPALPPRNAPPRRPGAHFRSALGLRAVRALGGRGGGPLRPGGERAAAPAPRSSAGERFAVQRLPGACWALRPAVLNRPAGRTVLQALPGLF